MTNEPNTLWNWDNGALVEMVSEHIENLLLNGDDIAPEADLIKLHDILSILKGRKSFQEVMNRKD